MATARSALPCGYAYYVVNKQEMFLLSSNPLSKPANLTLWDAVRQSQSGGWNLGSLSGVDVLATSGVDPNGSAPDIFAGLLTARGNGSGILTIDENDGGTLRHQISVAAYSTNNAGQESGRFLLAGVNGTSTRRILYLYAPNSGFVVGTDSKIAVGTLQPQTGGPFSNASVSGTYAGGTIFPVLTSVTNSVAAVLADGAGHITGSQYTSGPAGPGGPNNLTLTYQIDSTGRAVVDQNGQEFGVLYVVSPTKLVLLPTGILLAANAFASAGN